MNAPKKPGTDLSALKARLAKKAGGDAAPAPAAAEVAAPAAAAAPRPPARPGGPKKPAADPNFIPAPGEQAPSAPEAFIPAPGEQAPQMDIPAPGEVAQVRAAPAAAAAAAPARRNFEADDGAAPFSAGGSFDPTAGIIGGDSGGEIQGRSNKGLIGLAAAGALVVGILFGYVGNQITSKSALVEQGRTKGAVMFEEANKVAEMRKGISLKMADINKTIQTDPAKAAQELVTMLTTNFDKAPQVDQLFGWQLAAVHPEGIKRTFDLYEEANGLKVDLGYLAGFVNNNVKALSSGGPSRFAVKFGGKGATLVELVEALCGDPKAPAPCDGKAEPVGYNIRTETGGQPVFAPAGSDEGQVQPLSPEGSVYGYIVGLNPENNAKIVVGSLLGRINERLEAMSKAEGRALKALKRYSDDPNVDSPAADAD